MAGFASREPPTASAKNRAWSTMHASEKMKDGATCRNILLSIFGLLLAGDSVPVNANGTDFLREFALQWGARRKLLVQ